LAQQRQNLEEPNFRPVSMIENSDSPKLSSREKDFGMSCTVPRGIQPDVKTLQKSPRQKRLQKLSAGTELNITVEENGKQKSKGLLGRFKSKTQYGKPEAGVLMTEPARPVDEEEEDGSDSSSEDEKGGTIKFMPKLRHVSVKKSFRASSLDDESEPEYHQLFEYAFVVGLKEDPESNKVTTEMKYTFPPVAGMVFTGKDVALESIPQFCFPDIDRWRPTVKYTSETFSFVLTDIEGSKRFGYCRRLLPAGSGPRLPEVYCIVSPLGCFSLYAKILDHMEERRAVSSSAVFTFLKAISANPFPRPGRSVEIRTFSAKGTGMETVVFTRPMDSRLEHVDFSVLFSTLSCRKIIQLFSSMLMERRIILCAHSLSLLTGCAHALQALLYPFEWQHVFIPVLPTSLIDFVCSPLPYMMGIHPSCIKHLEDLEMEEAVVVDLEKKKFVRKIGDETSILPSKLFQYLEHSLSSSVISSEYQKSPSRRPHPSRADEIVVNTFMTFFVYLYGDYRRHLKTVNPAAGVMEFQKKDFVKSFSSKSIRRFLGAFHLTQMFENFIEQRENPAKAEMAAQSLFDRKKVAELGERCQEIEIFSSKSKFNRWKLRKGLAKKK